MTNIDWTQLEADREAGTPGPWRIKDCESYGDRCKTFFQEVWNDETDILVTTEVTRAHNDGGTANMRRIARLPALEAYALASREKLEAAERLIEGLERIVDAYGCDCAAEVQKLVAAYRAAGEGEE